MVICIHFYNQPLILNINSVVSLDIFVSYLKFQKSQQCSVQTRYHKLEKLSKLCFVSIGLTVLPLNHITHLLNNPNTVKLEWIQHYSTSPIIYLLLKVLIKHLFVILGCHVGSTQLMGTKVCSELQWGAEACEAKSTRLHKLFRKDYDWCQQSFN